MSLLSALIMAASYREVKFDTVSAPIARPDALGVG
jgi:hypothetical protein